MKTIRQFFQWVKKWFWTRPVSEPRPKATEVLHNYLCIKYHDQWINLRKNEIPAWNNMGRKDKRAMALRFRQMEKKGKIKFTEINGKMTCIKNKDYETIANNRTNSV